MMLGWLDGSLVGERAPQISGEKWFNSENLPAAARAAAVAGKPLSFSNLLAGTVVLVDFWDYSCLDCVRALPSLRDWWQRYQPQGFLIIGVHTPEFDFGRDPDNVESAVLQFRLDYPVVSDPAYDTWRRYHNDVWPRKLLVDQQGTIRVDQRGAGGDEDIEKAIERYLMTS